MKCLALVTGSLDSTLAVRLVQRQGVDVELVYFRTVCARHEPAAEVVAWLGAPLTTIDADGGHCHALRHPVLGRGKGAAACLDCRVWMLQRARQTMEERGAEFIVTGEVVGQRPHSQNRRELEAVEYHAGLEGRLLRPLSAQLLPATTIEQQGRLDRAALGRFHGIGRREMQSLAAQLELPPCPSSQAGCALTDRALAARVFDLFRHSPTENAVDFELLRVGRHFRFSREFKTIVGRNADENHRLRALARQLEPPPAIAEPVNFDGPTAILMGAHHEATELAAGLIHRFSRPFDTADPVVNVGEGNQSRQIACRPHQLADAATAIGVDRTSPDQGK